MVSNLLRLWLIFITFMVVTTFMVDFYYIYGWKPKILMLY